MANLQINHTVVATTEENHQTTGSVFNHHVVVEDTLSANFELIKILRRHQGEGRWILLIAPASIPSKELMACCNVDQKGVLVIHHRRVNDSFTTIKNALTQATCEAVVAWDNSLKQEELAQIDVLSEQSKCHFYTFSKQAVTPVQIETNGSTISH